MSGTESLLLLNLYGLGVGSICVGATELLNPRPRSVARIAGDLLLASCISQMALVIVVWQS